MPKVESNGIEINYELHGSSGAYVLCIMGITAPNEVWGDHVASWSQHFQCVTPDNRGVGDSDKPAGTYSSAMMADDHAGLLDQLGIDSAHIVGCSMGSIIAQQIALRHPSKVKSLVLMCPWARCDYYAKSVFRHIEVCKAHLTPADFMEWIQLLIFDKTSWDDPEFYQGMLDGRVAAAGNENPQPLHGLQGQAAACINHNTFDQLKTINAPTLIIGGENDIFTPRWMAEEIHDELPNSELYLYPQAGHGFHLENLEDFNQRVADFIKNHS